MNLMEKTFQSHCLIPINKITSVAGNHKMGLHNQL